MSGKTNHYSMRESVNYTEDERRPEQIVNATIEEAMLYRNDAGPSRADDELAEFTPLLEMYDRTGLTLPEEDLFIVQELDMRSSAIRQPEGMYDDYPSAGQVAEYYRRLLRPALGMDEVPEDSKARIRELQEPAGR